MGDGYNLAESCLLDKRIVGRRAIFLLSCPCFSATLKQLGSFYLNSEKIVRFSLKGEESLSRFCVSSN
jgi:hypothetical protein